jgi:hypothetical protein
VRCLALNASFEPLTMVPTRRALRLVIEGEAEIVEADGGTAPFSSADCDRLRRHVGLVEGAYMSQGACGHSIQGLQCATDQGEIGWQDLATIDSTATSGVMPPPSQAMFEMWFDPGATKNDPVTFALSGFHEDENEISNVNGNDWHPRLLSPRAHRVLTPGTD